MGKLIKILLGLVLVLVLLVVAAAVILPLVVNPNDYRGEIVEQVKKATGRDLVIKGDIGLSVFPWLGVKLGAMTLGQPQGFGDQPFAAVRHAQVRAKLLPLLKKRLQVDTVELDGLRLNLIRNAKGKGNWEDLAQSAAHPGAEPEAKPAPSSAGEGGPGLASLAIGGVSVNDAQVSWDDRSSGQKVVIKDLDLSTGALAPGRPLDLKLAFAVDNQTPKLSAKVSLSGRAVPSADGQKLTVTPFELHLADVQTGDGLSADVGLKAGLDLNLATQRYRLNGLDVEAEAKGSQLPGGEVKARFQAAADVDLARQTLALTGLRLQSAGLDLTGGLNGTHIQTAPSFTGSLKLAELSPRALMHDLGLPEPNTADAGVLKRFSLKTDLSATPKQVALDKLAMVLDDSTLDGDVRVLLNKTPGYRFALTLNAIDLDRYLPPPAAKPAAGAQPAKAAPAPAPAVGEQQPLFPVAMLRGLDVDGSFDVGHLVVHKLKLDAARITVKAKDGDVKVDQKVGGFYQGNLAGTIGVNVKGKTPLLTVTQHVNKIQAEPLVKDLLGQDRMSGTGNLNLDVNGSGQSVAAIKRSLGGKLDFAFIDGSIKGFNLGRMLREASARLQGKSLPPEQEAAATDFSELTGSAVIKDGVLHNDDLKAKSPLLRVSGKGTVNIGADTLDYEVRPVLVASLKGQGGESLDKLKGVPIPVRLTGPLAKPNWKIDLAAALAESQKAKLKQQINEKIQKALPQDLQKKLPADLGGALKGLLN